MSDKLRIGIINLMPQAERYEARLSGPLLRAARPIELLWIKLASHSYGSSDRVHLARNYTSFDAAIARDPLDGLIITGAPVEELAFSQVIYWPELQEILRYARAAVPQTLGLCWGGLALAKQLSIEKVNYPHKLFGVFELRALISEHTLLGPGDAAFLCPQSRHSGIDDPELERAAEDGRVRLLAYGPESGYSLFESADGRFVVQLGHPEYDADVLVREYHRDMALGRPGVAAPVGVVLSQPTTTWWGHREAFFGRWLRRCALHAPSSPWLGALGATEGSVLSRK